MKNLVEGQGDGNDLPGVHKSLGKRLDSLDIQEGALELFPLMNDGGMQHEPWLEEYLLQGGHYLHAQDPILTGGAIFVIENGTIQKDKEVTQIQKCYFFIVIAQSYRLLTEIIWSLCKEKNLLPS